MLISKSNRRYLIYSQAAVKFAHLLFVKPYTSRCKRCNKLTDEFALHIAFYCEFTANAREQLWKSICSTFGHQIFQEIMLCSPRLQLLHLLSGLRNLGHINVDADCLQLVGSFCINIFNRKYT